MNGRPSAHEAPRQTQRRTCGIPTWPKLKRGAEWKLTAVNGLFTILMLVTALMLIRVLSGTLWQSQKGTLGRATNTKNLCGEIMSCEQAHTVKAG